MPDYGALEHDSRKDDAKGDKPRVAALPKRGETVDNRRNEGQASMRREDMRAERAEREAAKRVPVQVRYRMLDTAGVKDGDDWLRPDNDALWREDDERD
jgi:hypothetical protein